MKWIIFANGIFADLDLVVNAPVAVVHARFLRHLQASNTKKNELFAIICSNFFKSGCFRSFFRIFPTDFFSTHRRVFARYLMSCLG